MFAYLFHIFLILLFMHLQQYLQERGYLYQYSHDAIFEKLEKGEEKFYV